VIDRLDTRETESVPATGEAATTIRLETVVNGRPVSAEIEPRTLLLDFLRDRLGLTGAKRSCDVQVCGVCTVLLDGKPVSACSTLAYEAHGREVLTIEGLARFGELHPIQQAFMERTAIQCGFCTPGMILTTKALLDENPRPTREEIAAYLGGNLCRCTGYWMIIEAVEHAARLMAGEEDRS
jgi:carbon-monoxide dehydrogenase small subunit